MDQFRGVELIHKMIQHMLYGFRNEDSLRWLDSDWTWAVQLEMDFLKRKQTCGF